MTEEVKTINWTIFEQLFLKPMLFIGMENVLGLIKLPEKED